MLSRSILRPRRQQRALLVFLGCCGLVAVLARFHSTGSADVADHRRGRKSVPRMTLSELEAATSDDAIFFFEANENHTEFDHMTACCLEAAARHNPSRKVVMAMHLDSKMMHYPRWLERDNLLVVKIDFAEVFAGTPVEDVWTSGRIHQGHIFVKNRSDLVRTALILKLGGAYLDSDVLSLGPLPERKNLLGAQARCIINNAFFQFERGHQFPLAILTDVGLDFKATVMNHHGPHIFTRLAREALWRRDPTLKENDKDCALLADMTEAVDLGEYAILPAAATHPLDVFDAHHYFDEVDEEDVPRILPGFAAHLRNTYLRIKKDLAPLLTERTLYWRMAAANCPATAEQMLRPMLGSQLSFDLLVGLGYKEKIY